MDVPIVGKKAIRVRIISVCGNSAPAEKNLEYFCEIVNGVPG
jgi:hypothetical protein